MCKSLFFCSFFAFRLEMHVRCGNQYKTRADRGTILGQSRLCECLDICGLSPAHESEMRDLPSLSADCKILISLILLKFSHSLLDWTALSLSCWFFLAGGGFFKNIFRGVCGPCHL